MPSSAPFPSASFPLKGRRVFIAGHRGMVGAALTRRFAREDCAVLTVGRESVDLTRQAETEDWIAEARPDAVILAAAHVGGILANASHPADFLYDNLMIAANVIEASRRADVKKLVFLGSSCIYPRLAPQPISEDALLTGPLEPTNEAYAIAKIAGLKLAAAFRRQHGADFISAMPTNLYGPGDNFDLEMSHVVPALIRKTHEAKLNGDKAVTIWGTGAPLREFLHVDDCADALVFLLKTYSGESHVNVGSGEEVSILELATTIAEIVGFEGAILTDPSKPDGTPRKRLDTGLLNRLGWRPRIALRDGLAAIYRRYLEDGPEGGT